MSTSSSAPLTTSPSPSSQQDNFPPFDPFDNRTYDKPEYGTIHCLSALPVDYHLYDCEKCGYVTSSKDWRSFEDQPCAHCGHIVEGCLDCRDWWLQPAYKCWRCRGMVALEVEMPRQRCENCQVKRQSNDELSGMILWMISLPMRCMSPKLVDLDDVLMAVEMRNREVREREKGEKEFVNL